MDIAISNESKYGKIVELMKAYSLEKGLTFHIDMSDGYVPMITYQLHDMYQIYIIADIGTPIDLLASAQDIAEKNYVYFLHGHAVTLPDSDTKRQYGPIGSIHFGAIRIDCHPTDFAIRLNYGTSRIALDVELFERLGAVEYYSMKAQDGDDKAIWGLARENSSAALEEALHFIHSPYTSVRYALAQSLVTYKFERKRVLATLEQLAKDTAAPVAEAAKKSMAMYSSK